MQITKTGYFVNDKPEMKNRLLLFPIFVLCTNFIRTFNMLSYAGFLEDYNDIRRIFHGSYSRAFLFVFMLREYRIRQVDE